MTDTNFAATREYFRTNATHEIEDEPEEKPRLAALMATESTWNDREPLAEIAKQLRIANLLAYANRYPTNPAKVRDEIDKGLWP